MQRIASCLPVKRKAKRWITRWNSLRRDSESGVVFLLAHRASDHEVTLAAVARRLRRTFTRAWCWCKRVKHRHWRSSTTSWTPSSSLLQSTSRSLVTSRWTGFLGELGSAQTRPLKLADLVGYSLF